MEAMNGRHKRILSIMSSGQKVLVNDLANQLEVSQATIRHDLTFLETQGFLRRVHGGAIWDETDDISHRMGVNYERKLKIARLARSYVSEGETIYIESGSINAIFAQEVAQIPGVTIITSNAFIARQIGKEATGSIILLGGIYQPESESLVGNLVKLCLDNLNYSKAFIGIDGYTKETGFTSRDLMRAEISREVISRSSKTFILSDSSKFGKMALSRFCATSDIDVLITDEGIPTDIRTYISESGVEVLIP